MTEEEHIRLIEIGDNFWWAFSAMAAQHIAMMPRELEHETIMYLQDRCSIYGSVYQDFLNLFPHPLP